MNKSSNLKGKDSMLPSGVIHVHLLGNYLIIIIEGINEQLKFSFKIGITFRTLM